MTTGPIAESEDGGQGEDGMFPKTVPTSERTVTITGIREWGKVEVTATADGPDARSIAGWKAFTRLHDAEPGTVREDWIGSLERPEGGQPFWNWLNTHTEMGGRSTEIEPTALNLDQFATLIGASREETAQRLVSGLTPDEEL